MEVKKKLDINPKQGKYFISLAKLIIPEHNLGKTTIPEYPTWVHVHTHSLGKSHPAGNGTKVNNINLGGKKPKHTKIHHQKTTN